MSKWQPIDTAPKDGTLILVWDGASVNVASWQQLTHRLGVWIGCLRTNFAEEPESLGEPTHWMPLPDPPTD